MATVVTNSNARSRTWDDYVDVQADVMPWMRMPATDQSDPYAMQNLQLITSATCQWVQKRLGHPVAPHLFQYYFDADGYGTTIMLPYPPILEIVSVVEWWGTSGPHVLSECTPSNQINGWMCEYPTGRLTRVFPGLIGFPWFPGVRNIYVEWWSGQNPVDADLKMATLEMIGHWFHMTQEETTMRLATGGASAEQVAGGMWTGTPLRIMNFLDEEIHIGIG